MAELAKWFGSLKAILMEEKEGSSLILKRPPSGTKLLRDRLATSQTPNAGLQSLFMRQKQAIRATNSLCASYALPSGCAGIADHLERTFGDRGRMTVAAAR